MSAEAKAVGQVSIPGLLARSGVAAGFSLHRACYSHAKARQREGESPEATCGYILLAHDAVRGGLWAY